MQNHGWIQLHRQMRDWQWKQCPEVFCLFVDLLLSVNEQDGFYKEIEVKRGEIITTVDNLIRNTGLSSRTIRTALDKLRKTGEIILETTNRFTKITVVNFDFYQNGGDNE